MGSFGMVTRFGKLSTEKHIKTTKNVKKYFDFINLIFLIKSNNILILDIIKVVLNKPFHNILININHDGTWQSLWQRTDIIPNLDDTQQALCHNVLILKLIKVVLEGFIDNVLILLPMKLVLNGTIDTVLMLILIKVVLNRPIHSVLILHLISMVLNDHLTKLSKHLWQCKLSLISLIILPPPPHPSHLLWLQST